VTAADEVSFTLRVPRAALTVIEPARTVSQRTVEKVLGISRRTFLGSLGEFERHGGSVIRLGKLRLVDVEPYLKWLRAREVSRPVEAANITSIEDELGLVLGAK